jgi:hypothetical protein
LNYDIIVFKEGTWLILCPSMKALMKRNPRKINPKKTREPTSQAGINCSSRINSKELSESAALNIQVKSRSRASL